MARSYRLTLGTAAVLALVLSGAGAARQPQNRPATATMRTFDGTWSAAGTRELLPTDGTDARLSHLSGAIVLGSPDALGTVGMLGEVIAFEDGHGLSVGRAVWTDSRGDRVYSALTGEPIEGGRRIRGTFTGGTGRYARASGTYEFSWQYVVETGEFAVQGRAGDLHGHFTLGPEAP